MKFLFNNFTMFTEIIFEIAKYTIKKHSSVVPTIKLVGLNIQVLKNPTCYFIAIFLY